MHHLYAEAHRLGITKPQITDTLSHLPLSPFMIQALHHIKHHGRADILILSDANTVFIETLLEAHQVRHLVSRIITNPAQFDDQGRLHIRRRIRPGLDQPHGCQTGTCSLNICKGRELVNVKEEGPNIYETVVYVGDGRNDFCPSLQLTATDHVLVRKGRTLERMMLEHRPSLRDLVRGDVGAVVAPDDVQTVGTPMVRRKVRANVHFWSDAAEALDLFRVIFPERSANDPPSALSSTESL